MALRTLTKSQIIYQLSSGHSWYGSTITYSFPTSAPFSAVGTERSGFSTLNTAQANAITLAIGLWADLIAVPVVDAGAGYANITVSNFYDRSGRYYAYTYLPYSGTVWFNTYFNGAHYGKTNDLVHPVIGMHGFATFIHELGHAFGLDHAGNYNAGEGVAKPGSYQDSTVYSIMSYFGPGTGDGIDPSTRVRYSREIAWGSWGNYDAQTPMLNDILAIQNIYGVSTTTRVGDTIYGFNSNVTGAEASLYNFALNSHPIMCIFDSSGNDTLDLSGDAHNDLIDLNSGAFSNVMGLTNNISIAYSALIENAIGGRGNDTIIGNGADNSLVGGAGNDIITGGAGADTLDGGTGINTLNYASSAAGVNVNLAAHTASGGDAEGDSFLNFQNLSGSASGANTLIGDASANLLTGGAGNDFLEGFAGNDKLTGGAGADTFAFLAGDSGTDEITDFRVGVDHVLISKAFAAAYSSLHFKSKGANTILSLGTEIIQFDRVAASALHATDFVFV